MNKEASFSTYDNVVMAKQYLKNLVNRLQVLHNQNNNLALAGMSFQSTNQLEVNEAAIFRICGTRPKGTVSYSRTIEEVYFCEDCKGKLVRLYADDDHSLTQKGHYYKCAKCEKLYSPLAIEKIKNTEIPNS